MIGHPINNILFEKNPCATGKSGSMTPSGVMVHSVGVKGTDHTRWQKWDIPTAQKCVHYFVDTLGIWQALEDTKKAWHAGGSANNTHISFEICEPWEDTTENANDLYDKTVWLCTTLCRRWHLPASAVTSHAEGHAAGIASNHGDPVSWWKKSAVWSAAGYTMERLRADVAAALAGEIKVEITEETPMTQKIVDNLPENDPGLNLRSAPNGAVLKTLPEGTTVTLTGQTSGSWVQVTAAGTTGWVWSAYLEDVPETPAASEGTQDTVTIALPRSAAATLASALEKAGL